MELKKGFYFTLDSIVAGGIILTLIMLISPSYIEEHTYINLNYLSNDLIGVLGRTTVDEVDNTYIGSLVNDKSITNLNNTILEQIGEFWADNRPDLANKTASNATDLWVPDNIGVGIWINNETIYNRDMPIRKSLISSKKIISGIKKGNPQGHGSRNNPPALWGPAIIEVRVWE